MAHAESASCECGVKCDINKTIFMVLGSGPQKKSELACCGTTLSPVPHKAAAACALLRTSAARCQPAFARQQLVQHTRQLGFCSPQQTAGLRSSGTASLK